jgi:hypothetical protein
MRHALVVAASLAIAASIGCSDGSPQAELARTSLSPSARPATVQMLLEDLEAPRHPADGGGRAWLEDPARTPAAAGGRGRYHIVYEAGELGVAEGGAIYLLVSPFWGWSQPQVASAGMPGYTRVTTEAPGLRLEPETVDSSLLAITVRGRDLVAGETLGIVYGAGEAGAMVDHFAESAEHLWIAVDGDGDGVREVLADSPTVRLVAGAPARLVLHLPSVVRPGETARLTVAVLDRLGNAGTSFAGELELQATPELPGLPARLHVHADDRGLAAVEVTPHDEAVYRVTATAGSMTTTSNPMEVTTLGTRVLWADLHGHSSLSDGTGTPEDYLRYARDVARLDVAALTDHDHWGVRFLDREPELWQQIRDQVAAFHEPGSFVTLLGYEWTSWLHGHRHVIYFSDHGEVYSSIDPATDTPAELWQALRGQAAMTFAHHSAGGPVATNWDYAPDPVLEPLTEVSSVHGSSEAADSPRAIYSPVPGNTVRDALDRGYRLGFVGSGDSHDGHPGLAHLASPTGGVAAIISDELSREAIASALAARRVYATNGPRIVLRVAVAGQPMGSVVAIGPEASAEVFARITAVAEIERVDLISRGGVVATAPGEGRLEMQLLHQLEDLQAGDYAYVRVVQVDDGAAWSSPVFFE